MRQQRLHVVAAVIVDAHGRILLAKRPHHLHQGGLWEFPGGKCEPGERAGEALVRELEEELGITATAYRPLIGVAHDYPDRSVYLDVWRVTEFTGEPHGAEGQEVRWVEAAELGQYRFPAANAPIVAAARLPACYLITPEPGDSTHWPAFIQHLQQSLRGGISLVQLRAKQLAPEALAQLAPQVVECCHRHGARVLLNGDPQLAHDLGFDGVQLDGARVAGCSERPMPADYLVAASCHDEAQLNRAALLHCDFALLSPVAATASHPGEPGMGWEAFGRLVLRASMPVYALGGVERRDLETAWRHGAQGIAAIRALWQTEESF